MSRTGSFSDTLNTYQNLTSKLKARSRSQCPRNCNKATDLPELNFKLVDGEELSLPSEMSSRYIALLFFRGAW